MKKILGLAVAALVGTSAAYATLQGDEKKEKPKEVVVDAPLVCPVMGSKIASKEKANSNVVVNGVRYYICCGGCTEPFKKEPAKYTKFFPVVLKKNNVKLTEIKVCPMSKAEVKGEAANFTEVGMFKVDFCCAKCPEAFAKLSQEEKEKKIQAFLPKEAPKKVIEVKVCPQTGEAIDSVDGKEFSIINEYKVYFCCPGCKPAFDKLSKDEQLKKAAQYAKKSS